MKGAHCTCHVKYHHNNFRETEADEEGKCIKCGHYAIYISHHELFPRSSLGSCGKGSIHGYRPIFRVKETWNLKGYSRRKKDDVCDT